MQKAPALSLVPGFSMWLRELDLNQRPSGYEPDELPDCSIPRLCGRILRTLVGLSIDFSKKVFFLQMLSACPMLEFSAWGRPGGACSEIPVRKIIHIDCDCFYAALEMRDDPSLRGKALAVGGSPDKRGVVATLQLRGAGLWRALGDGHAHGAQAVPICWWCARVSMSTGRCRSRSMRSSATIPI